MKCPNCEKEVPEGKGICGSCGFDLAQKSVGASEQERTIKSKKRSTPREEAQTIVAKPEKPAEDSIKKVIKKPSQKKKVSVWLFIVPIVIISVIAIINLSNGDQSYNFSKAESDEPSSSDISLDLTPAELANSGFHNYQFSYVSCSEEKQYICDSIEGTSKEESFEFNNDGVYVSGEFRDNDFYKKDSGAYIQEVEGDEGSYELVITFFTEGYEETMYVNGIWALHVRTEIIP